MATLLVKTNGRLVRSNRPASLSHNVYEDVLPGIVILSVEVLSLPKIDPMTCSQLQPLGQYDAQYSLINPVPGSHILNPLLCVDINILAGNVS
jgi:hypothetical protein